MFSSRKLLLVSLCLLVLLSSLFVGATVSAQTTAPLQLISWDFEGGNAGEVGPSSSYPGISGFVSSWGGWGDPYMIPWIAWGNSVNLSITVNQPVTVTEIAFDAGHNRYWWASNWNYYRPKQVSVELSPVNAEPPMDPSQWQPVDRIRSPWNPPSDGYAVLGVVDLPINPYEMLSRSVASDVELMPGTYVVRFLTRWYPSGWNGDVNQYLYLDNIIVKGTVLPPIEALPKLVEAYVTNPGVATGLMAKLQAIAASMERGNARSKQGQVKAFVNQVKAQTGKSITNEQAELLIQLAGDL